MWRSSESRLAKMASVPPSLRLLAMAHAQSPNEQISGGHGGISPYLLWYGCLARSNQRLWAARPEIRTTEMASNDDASLAANHSDWPETAQHAPTPHTQQIGPYKTLEVLGEGGMGVVYRAQQTKPIKREVALKLIKLGMDTKQVIARFESERQALALMDHPNVAKVFDAGATEQGRPYFVMELIHGLPITEHCDRHKLSIDQRLDLFMKACEAIQHAHQKGIIHRDIKPGNILVEYRDGQATPKIIDFGVAKATSQRLTEKTLFTEQGQMIGTPAYMSPEQADLSSQDIDTRSDIYSLGVLLYELLTGTLPFDAKSLRIAGFGEIQRIIRDEEPPKPSTRMTTGGFVSSDQKDAKDASSVEAAAKKRRSDPHTLMKRIRGDLDWIVLKCLEKDRSRRYASAADFAADLRRHLKNEPVQAGSPSATYRLIKFLRRNKGRIGMVGAVSIGLLLAALGFVQADRARERAVSGDVQAYLLWLDENPLTHPSAYGNKHTLEAIVDRIRSGEASAFDYQALVKTVFKFEFAGRGGFIDARDASMVKGTGTLRHLSIAPNGLGLLVSPRVLLDGQPFPEAPWPEEEVVPLIAYSNGSSVGGHSYVISDFLDDIPLGRHRLDGYVHVQIIESKTGFTNYRRLPGATVNVPITPFSFDLVDEYPENFHEKITKPEWAHELDEGFELEITRWGSGSMIMVVARFPKPRMNLACGVTLWSTEFEWVATFSLAAWFERCWTRVTSAPQALEGHAKEITLNFKGAIGNRALVWIDLGDLPPKALDVGATVHFQMVASEEVARNSPEISEYLDLHIERTVQIVPYHPPE